MDKITADTNSLLRCICVLLNFLYANVSTIRFAFAILPHRCSCNFCRDELLVGALEYRCCREVICAIGKAIFDGSIDQITCITQHEDYNSMINTAVLTMVGPLLRSIDGRYYKRKSGQNQNE